MVTIMAVIINHDVWIKYTISFSVDIQTHLPLSTLGGSNPAWGCLYGKNADLKRKNSQRTFIIRNM